MIANGLIFLLGVFSATLLALLLAPIVWKKAQALAYRRFRASIPATVNEVKAEADHVRAEAALRSRRQEIAAEEIREAAALERAEAGRVASVNADLTAKNRELAEAIAGSEEEIDSLRTSLEAREADNERLTAALRETEHDLAIRSEEMDALAQRFRELTEIAEERKINLITQETRLDQVSDDLRNSERRNRDLTETNKRLKQELVSLGSHVEREKTQAARLEERVTRLTSQLADRDEKLRYLESRSGTKGAQTEKRANGLGPASFGGANGKAARQKLIEDSQNLRRDLLNGTSGSSDADLRDRVSDIAARIIHTVAADGEADSPIRRLLDGTDAPSSGPAAGANGRSDTPEDGISLAGRIRAFAASELPVDETEAPSKPSSGRSVWS